MSSAVRKDDVAIHTVRRLLRGAALDGEKNDLIVEIYDHGASRQTRTRRSGSVAASQMASMSRSAR